MFLRKIFQLHIYTNNNNNDINKNNCENKTSILHTVTQVLTNMRAFSLGRTQISEQTNEMKATKKQHQQPEDTLKNQE